MGDELITERKRPPEQMGEERSGVLYSLLAYILWGFLPVYWKIIDYVNPDEILAHRIMWSFVFSFFLLLVMNRRKQFMEAVRLFRREPKQMIIIFFASIIISGNWFMYIWAVNSNHVTDASLGYYINPLVSVLLGMIFFKERLNRMQALSFLSAAIGVVILTASHGSFPFVAFGLATTFGFYGLLKKLVRLDALIGLAIETFFVVPMATGYWVYLLFTGKSAFLSVSLATDLFLIGAGIATLLPLVFFAKGTQRIPLYYIGILQYIAPTLMLILGVFVYHERFTSIQFIAFSFIWFALALFTFGNLKDYLLKHRKKKGLQM